MLGTIKRIAGLAPKKGDRVWWATHGMAMKVTNVIGDQFSADSIRVKIDAKGKEQPVKRVGASNKSVKFNRGLNAWVLGTGPTPRDPSVFVITPDPVRGRFSA